MQSRMEKFGKLELDRPRKYIARVRDDEAQAETYDLNTIDILLQEMKAHGENSLLFLVDINHHLHLARAKKASHVQMAKPINNSALCLTAGHMIFDEDFKLIGINNFSYRFGPPHFSSIKWLLVVIIEAQQQLNLTGNDKITLELEGLHVEELQEPDKNELSWYTNKSLMNRSTIGQLSVSLEEIEQYINLAQQTYGNDTANTEETMYLQEFNLLTSPNGFFTYTPTKDVFSTQVNRTLKF